VTLYIQLIWIAKTCGLAAHWNFSYEVVVSYLPLSHVAAQIVDIYCPLMYAASVYFAQPDALKVFLYFLFSVIVQFYHERCALCTCIRVSPRLLVAQKPC